jgi:hypothetical protein
MAESDAPPVTPPSYLSGEGRGGGSPEEPNRESPTPPCLSHPASKGVLWILTTSRPRFPLPETGVGQSASRTRGRHRSSCPSASSPRSFNGTTGSWCTGILSTSGTGGSGSSLGGRCREATSARRSEKRPGARGEDRCRRPRTARHLRTWVLDHERNGSFQHGTATQGLRQPTRLGPVSLSRHPGARIV